MSTQLIIWCSVAAIVLAAIVARVAAAARRHHRHMHIIEIGREWEEIYIPGDKLIKDDFDYDEFDGE